VSGKRLYYVIHWSAAVIAFAAMFAWADHAAYFSVGYVALVVGMVVGTGCAALELRR
jgi:hypothetical protein